MLGEHEMVESIKYVGEVGYRKNSYDIIIISYALSEMDGRMQKWLISKFCKCLRNGGYLVIIEPAYKGMRKYIGDFLKDRQVRGSFKIVDVSGPLCSEQNCDQWSECYGRSIKRKKLRTPAGMTEEMKRFFEGGKKEGKIKWVYTVLKNSKAQVFVDPSKVEEYGGKGNFVLCGWVIKKQIKKAANITLCNGLGPCNLAFWKERGVYEQVQDVSKGDILWIEGDYSGSSFDNLPSVYVSRIIEHIKKI